jgi:N-acylneuraminate cytidylyltransferase
MNICIIPARGGSKRIPRKNIKKFCGKSMIGYSIEAALESKCFDKVIVSTEDAEIAEVSKSFGAEVPFIRPSELANDYIGTIPVIRHAIEWCNDQGWQLRDVCCLYATAPFVQAGAIQESYSQFRKEGVDYCFTVTSFASPIQRAIRITKENRVDMFNPENFNVRSQDLEEAYHDAGQFYWGSANSFKKNKLLFSIKSMPYILPRYLVQDIDTIEDWVGAENMYQALKFSENIF